jgi:alkanesulfonate monooxygenase SsuD/methylene tetrahydromethanopterin reductase-like flavin-dependent oxidoreductase (luciferase family)
MKLRIEYDCCMELYHPNIFLELAPLAEKAGFDTIWASDHFHPSSNSASAMTRTIQKH